MDHAGARSPVGRTARCGGAPDLPVASVSLRPNPPLVDRSHTHRSPLRRRASRTFPGPRGMIEAGRSDPTWRGPHRGGARHGVRLARQDRGGPGQPIMWLHGPAGHHGWMGRTGTALERVSAVPTSSSLSSSWSSRPAPAPKAERPPGHRRWRDPWPTPFPSREAAAAFLGGCARHSSQASIGASATDHHGCGPEQNLEVETQ